MARLALVRTSSKGTAGFSLIEVLLAVVLFSVGLIAVNRIFIGSLDALAYSKFRLEADQIAEAKIWEIQKKAWLDSVIPAEHDKGSILGRTHAFSYEYQSAKSGISDYLYGIRLYVRDESFGKNRELVRDFYARLPNSKKI